MITNRYAGDEPVVVVANNVRLPGAEGGIAAFEDMLYSGRDCIHAVPESRFDRSLYFDSNRGIPGKTYTTLGGCVNPDSLDPRIAVEIEAIGKFDLVHQHFADVAATAWRSLGDEATATLATRCGVFVGHSGGTDQGGDMVMATLAQSVAAHLQSTKGWGQLSAEAQRSIQTELVDAIRERRPRSDHGRLRFHAYSAASLVAQLLQIAGPRAVIDAACASSLIALHQAMMAIRMGDIEAAIVGGATYNSVDNLILFSQSQACTDETCQPFDSNASGLVSSEGYVAVVITRQSIAESMNLPILGIINEVGVATDGRGKSLWAPRTEGQQLAIVRAYPGQTPLSVDYQEAHATSTQLGDATELHSLASVMKQNEGSDANRLLIGSVKSNVGHTLEAAGLVGLVKVLISLRRSLIPASIHVDQPTEYFAWSEHAIDIVTEPKRWVRKSNTSRRAAVNAFGIGGINAHATIEDAPARVSNRERVGHSPSQRSGSRPRVPLAIVGRGVVLAGASNVEAFAALLRSSESHLRASPPERWIHNTGVTVSQKPTVFTTPTNVGGYIVDYQFDGRPYRIPPKQIERANPIQLMLLDAVDQARKEWFAAVPNEPDRERIGVVIGSVFGGDFSNQLQIGLRIPELLRHVDALMQNRGIDDRTRKTLLDQYREELLLRYPALLDETGSFTASTLASRIAKTFDWMGGACAVDADDASGAYALWVAANWLRSGQLDAVVCGVAQRSMDLVAYEQFDLRGRLVRSGRPSDVPRDGSQVLPGEGVAAVVIRRLDDAIQHGEKIYGIIDDVVCDSDRHDGDRRSMPRPTSLDHDIICRSGYLIGAHCLVRVIAETTAWEDGLKSSETIAASSEDHVHYEIFVRSREVAVSPMNPIVAPISPVESSTTIDHNDTTNSPMAVLRIESNTKTEFEALLEAALESPTAFCDSIAFRQESNFRAAVLGHTEPDFNAGIQEILKACRSGVTVKAFPKLRAMMVDRTVIGDRIGWVFPGQGSQYAAIPSMIEDDERAAAFMQSFDNELTRQSIAPITDRLHDPDQQLGKNIWFTQAWVLGVTSAIADGLRRAGHSPDVVLGHSFGEWGAALHAGVLTLSQAISLAKVRSESVSMTRQNGGRLLSVRAQPSELRTVLINREIPCEITHYNSTDQTVIAGDEASIRLAKTVLGEHSIASAIIAVPAAFHTSSMNDAQRLLATAMNREMLLPPYHTFLSATTATFLAEPREIADVLVNQLTRPVLYQPAANRLIDAGCGLLLEVGPNDVLTRLNESIAAGRALCFAIDHRHGTHRERMQWLDVAIDCIGKQTIDRKTGVTKVGPAADANRSSVDISTPSEPQVVDVEVFDVTSRGRRGAAAKYVKTGESAVVSAARNLLAILPNVNELSRDLVVAKATPAVPTTITDETELADSIEAFMIDFVIDQTGYAPDVVDLDADLESELAIDSIKKAQLLGELQEQYDLHAVEFGRLTLADFGNLRSIRDFVVNHLASQDDDAGETASELTVINGGPSQHVEGDADYVNGFEYGSKKKSSSAVSSGRLWID